MTGDSVDSDGPDRTVGGSAAQQQTRSPRSRSKAILVGLIALAGALALAAATQTWIEIELVEGAAAQTRLDVTGQRLNPSLSPVAIAVLAAALVLTIAGPVLRRGLGALVMLCGTGIGFLGVGALSDPHLSPSSAVAEATGIVGGAQYELVSSVLTTAWPGVAAACGAVAAIAGLLVIVRGGSWRSAGRRYEAQPDRGTPRVDDGAPDRISDWDELSAGDDPTQPR